MTKILVECPQQIASVRVGVLEPLRSLEDANLCQVRYRDTKQIIREDISWCDILVCVRGCEYPTLRIIQAAKDAGRFLVYFLDDDLLNIPEGNASSNYYRDNKIKVYLTRIMGLCDVLWAVNNEIIRKYEQYTPRSILLRVPTEVLRQPPEPSKPIHVLYAGSVDHSGLVQEILVPVVLKLLDNYSGRVDFTFIGANPNLKHIKGVSYFPFFESYEEYRKEILSGGFSIGLAPVYDTPFYRCKYYNKFIEYSGCGIAGIYSDCEPYRQVVKQGVNGILCENDTISWYQAVEHMIDAPWRAEEIATQAADLLRKDFNYAAIGQALQTQLPEVVSYYAPAISESEVCLPLMKLIFYQERLLLLYRIYGLLSVFIVPLKAFKKLREFIWKKLRKK